MELAISNNNNNNNIHVGRSGSNNIHLYICVDQKWSVMHGIQ